MKIFKIITKIVFVFILFIYFLERKKPERVYLEQNKHDFFNISLGIINNIISSVIVKKTYFVFDLAKNKKVGLLNFIKLPTFLNYLIALTFIDFWMYWWHRINHEVPFLWKFHKLHHTDESLDSTSAIRFHPLEIIISSFIRIIVLLPFGINPEHITLYEKILSSVIFFNHSNINISNKLDFIFRRFIVSPEIHRTHHSNNIEEANSNYSSVSPYWDMLFKTYTRNPKKKVDFGVF